ncbi:hypothetical protein QQ045_007493 [Rhodiola kirilowii]
MKMYEKMQSLFEPVLTFAMTNDRLYDEVMSALSDLSLKARSIIGDGHGLKTRCLDNVVKFSQPYAMPHNVLVNPPFTFTSIETLREKMNPDVFSDDFREEDCCVCELLEATGMSDGFTP